MSTQQPSNRLAGEKSPYLLQHAHNPVDWYPYGEEAFSKARQEDKPIFLSIGYSTCHWCHVMERESFEDPDVARVMNDLYVNIKVDREERPDVDQVYLRAAMFMQGQAGWPLSVWLTPDLEPFYAGTYFPAHSRMGMPGFVDILQSLASFWRRNRGEVKKRAGELVEAIRRTSVARASEEGSLPQGLVDRGIAEILQRYDPAHGGFGNAPKFPQPPLLAALVHHHARRPSDEAAAAVTHTLERMWRGGLYDHVGGGFARYSTDEHWLVPHFEKMLYDNAQLVGAYLDGHLLAGREDFACVARDVLDFVEREMTGPQGGFFSAQDADSEGEEGRFYVFTQDELLEALGADWQTAARLFGATSMGNFEGSNVLHLPRSLEQAASEEGVSVTEAWRRYGDLRQRLRTWREQRVRPGVDDKVITGWNGLMIHAWARASAVLDEPRYAQVAARAAEFLDAHVRDGRQHLLRRWRAGEARHPAALDDYAFLGLGLLALFEATGSARWLARALELAESVEELFGDTDGPGYFYASGDADVPVRMKDADDGALPPGNAVQALLLARLGSVLEREDLRERARNTVEAFGDLLRRHPGAFPTFLCALEELQELPRTLTVAGDPEHPGWRSALVAAHRELMPGRVVVPVPVGERARLAALGVPVEGREGDSEGPALLLCEAGTCRPFVPES